MGIQSAASKDLAALEAARQAALEAARAAREAMATAMAALRASLAAQSDQNIDSGSPAEPMPASAIGGSPFTRSAEFDQLSALAESAATGGVAAVEEQVTWAINLLNLNADSATISDATLDDILALSTSDFELLAANRPVVNSLLDHGLTLSNTVLALQTGTPEEISTLISADPAHFALINSLLDNGISPTSVVNTYLPNAAVISDFVDQGATLDEIAALPTSDFELLAANRPVVNSLLDHGLTLSNTVLALQTGTPEEISTLISADPAYFALINSLLDNGISSAIW